jgi:hypothetical protein
MKVLMGIRGIILSFFNLGARSEWVVNPTPRPLTGGKDTRYTLYMRRGRPQRRFGQMRESSPPTGFDPRTVQPVVSRYTDWAIPAFSKKGEEY